MLYEYRAKIIAVYDGDTVTAQIDLGFNVCVTEKLRLYGINAPELRGEEREAGLVSRDRLRELILYKDVTVSTYKDKKGKYGRYLADISIQTGYDEEDIIQVNDWLVEKGLAKYKEY